MQDIESGDVLAMTDATCQDVISEINSKRRQMRLSSILGWSTGFAASVIALAAESPVPLVLVVLAYGLGRWLDSYRRTTVLFFNLEPAALDDYRRLMTAFEELCNSAKTWHVSAEGRVLDWHTWKRNAGADKLIKSSLITPGLRLPAEIRSNLEPPHFKVGRQDLYFLPDFVLITDPTGAGGISYAQLNIEVRNARHIENGSLPSDAQVIDHTWQHLLERLRNSLPGDGLSRRRHCGPDD